jgi:hypothetical protein
MLGDALPKTFLALVLAMIMTGCDQREAALRRKIIGNWELTNTTGRVTISPDGTIISRFSIGTQIWVYEGTWRLRDGQIEMTTTSRNSAPFRGETSFRIIRADGQKLIYEWNGQTISLSRKQ